MQDNVDSEVTVVSSDNIKFIGKRMTLMEKSDYFKALCCSGMKDSNASTIKLPCLDSSGLSFVFSFLSDKKEKLTMDTVPNVLHAASYLQIQALNVYCLNFLKENLSCQNCLKIKDIAEDFQLDELSSFVDAFICEHFEEIAQGDVILNMSRESIVEYTNDDRTNVKSEIVLFKAALKWAEAQGDVNLEVVSDIVKGVRFPLMTKQELDECKACLLSLGLSESGEVFKWIETAQEHLGNPHILLDYSDSKIYYPRCISQIVLAFGGFTATDHSTNRIMMIPSDELLENAKVTWRTHHPSKDCLKLPKALCEHCVVSYGVYIFVAGGQTKYCQDGRHTQENVFRLDTRNGSWMEVSMHAVFD